MPDPSDGEGNSADGSEATSSASGAGTSSAPQSIYRFGTFELDTLRETLKGPDGPVPLRDHALRVLILLVERAPEVVRRDDILDGVWGHQALSESSIAQVIRDIRACLGDSARSPELVATRYGRGYQFVGDVERVERPRSPVDAAAESPDESLERITERSAASEPARTRRPIFGVAALAVCLAALVGWLALRDGPETSESTTVSGQTVTLRAVASEDGESLSGPFVDYLAFVLGDAMGADRVDIAQDDEETENADRLVEITLASLQSGDRRMLELKMGGSTIEGSQLRLRFDEASDLVRRSLDEILASLEREIDEELRVSAGLVSQSSFATETLLRGMSAQLAGDVGRAAELFEAAIAEDPDFEFARYELAIAVRRTGQFERALAILEPMSQRLVSDFWTHRINNAMGIAYWQLQRFDEALNAFRRAEAVSDSPAQRAIVLNNIALLERNQGRLAEAEATVRESIRLAELAEKPRLEGGSRNTLASILMRTEREDDALVELRKARDLYYETGNLAGYAAVLSRAARIHAARVELTEAESLLRLALGVREQVGDDDGIADIRLRLARIHRIRGEFESARELTRQALDQALALDDDGLIIDGYQALATQALAERQFDAARNYGEEGLRLAELTGRESDRRAIRQGLLQADLEDPSTPDPTVDALRELTEEADSAGDETVGVRARLLAARVFLRLDRADDARRLLERAEGLLEARDVRLMHEIDAQWVALSLDKADLERAERALARMERTNASPHPTLMLRARLQAAQGNLKAAVETAGLARSTTGDWWRTDDRNLLDAWSRDLAQSPVP